MLLGVEHAVVESVEWEASGEGQVLAVRVRPDGSRLPHDLAYAAPSQAAPSAGAGTPR